MSDLAWACTGGGALFRVTGACNRRNALRQWQQQPALPLQHIHAMSTETPAAAASAAEDGGGRGPEEPQASQAAWRRHHTVFTNAKGGMASVDMEHVQRVVYEMSKVATTPSWHHALADPFEHAPGAHLLDAPIRTVAAGLWSGV